MSWKLCSLCESRFLSACVNSGDKLRLSNVSLLVNRTKPNGPKEEAVLHCLSLMSYKAASSPRFSNSSSKQ